MSEVEEDEFQVSGTLDESGDQDVPRYKEASAAQKDGNSDVNCSERSEQGPTESAGGYTASYNRDHNNAFNSNLTSLIQGFVEQTRSNMDKLLSSMHMIDSSLDEVIEELRTARDFGMERKSKLEEERDHVHEAALRVLEVLNVNSNLIEVRTHSALDLGAEEENSR